MTNFIHKSISVFMLCVLAKNWPVLLLGKVLLLPRVSKLTVLQLLAWYFQLYLMTWTVLPRYFFSPQLNLCFFSCNIRLYDTDSHNWYTDNVFAKNTSSRLLSDGTCKVESLLQNELFYWFLLDLFILRKAVTLSAITLFKVNNESCSNV